MWFCSSIVAKPPSVHGLFAAFSFGILRDDPVLSKTVLNELKPMQDMPEYIFHISTFLAYFKFLQVTYEINFSI